jgi:PAS domain S-box-containing protein
MDDRDNPSPCPHVRDAFTDRVLQQMVDVMPDAIVGVDEVGVIVIANTQVERVFGYPPDELLGTGLERLVPERFRTRHAGHTSRYHHRPHGRSMGETGIALFAIRKDGSEFPAEISLSNIAAESGRLVIAVVRDITERLVAESVAGEEAHRRDVMAAMLAAEEAERARIAAALHDDTIQVMTASLFALDRALAPDRDPRHITAIVQGARETIRQATERTRQLMFELQPAVLYEQGIAAAITPLVAHASRDIGADWTVEASPARFPRPVEELVYRTIREAITNVRKHSQASRVSVTMTFEKARLTVVVTDNGRGFAPDHLRRRPDRLHHIGLETMTERVRMAHGEIRIDSHPGTGTQVAFAVPLKHPSTPPGNHQPHVTRSARSAAALPAAGRLRP